MKKTKDIKQTEVDLVDFDRDSHESFGLISLSRVTCSGEGKSLYGSVVQHNSFISLTISTSVRDRNAFSEHHFERNKIIEVCLAPSQLTDLISNMNTPGVPCTLRWVKGEGYKEECPSSNLREEMTDDVNEKFKQLSDHLSELGNIITDSLSGSVKKADKENIKGAIQKIQTEVGSNLPYLQKVQLEKLENAISHAKAEVESTVHNVIYNTGVKSLKKQIHIQLPDTINVKK